MNSTSYQHNLGCIYSVLPEFQLISTEIGATITFFILKNQAVINGITLEEGRFISFDSKSHKNHFEIATPENATLFWLISYGIQRPLIVRENKSAPRSSLQMYYWMSKIMLQLKDRKVMPWEIKKNSLVLEALISEDQKSYKVKSGKFENVFAIVKAMDDLQKVPMRNWTVALPINATHLSPQEFQRIFRAIYGISVNELLTCQKMFLAANLLQQSQQSIATIGTSIGFSSDRNFTTSFKHHFNTTPASFRKVTDIA